MYNNLKSRYCRIYRCINRNRDVVPEPMSRTPDLETGDTTPYVESSLPDETRLVGHPDASNPVLTKDDVDDAVASFVADPFLVYEGGIYHLFFEIKNVVGEVFIGHAYSEDGIDYEYNKIVIDPTTAQHTYPHVFRYDGSWLMVPSPGPDVAGECRIYRAVDFPTSWELESVPIPTGVRVDPTPIRHDGTWYVIHQDMDSLDIGLKYSDSLFDEGWEDHPDNPIFTNDRSVVSQSPFGKANMAPSGRPLYRSDSIDVFYRSYLEREVSQYRIERLSPDAFQQRLVEQSIFRKMERDDWNRKFMHTVNPVYPWSPDRNMVAVDGLSADSSTYSIGICSFE
ncbi:hypothetical protein SAMN05216218_1032 [Halorientalis regularis]|uniref:Glucosamine inositolphosphorylceramide transferase 1 N-terminal domain-containing protein n=1 Tax=Halorientalis regularis TaxID=660518 RepID=A0A1G7HFG5_9EURY|nr:hypothetical protein SAMN05216218_1032 [Halorientalis regularis]